MKKLNLMQELKLLKKKKKLVFHRIKQKNNKRIKILEYNLKENNYLSLKVIV